MRATSLLCPGSVSAAAPAWAPVGAAAVVKVTVRAGRPAPKQREEDKVVSWWQRGHRPPEARRRCADKAVVRVAGEAAIFLSFYFSRVKNTNQGL